jgi:hypothetical protein
MRLELLPVDVNDRLAAVAGVACEEECQGKSLSRTVPAPSPKVDGIKIEHARVGVRLRETAFDQVRQQLIEASKSEV